MAEVGVRELRDHLSKYPERVQGGRRMRTIGEVLDLLAEASSRPRLALWRVSECDHSPSGLLEC